MAEVRFCTAPDGARIAYALHGRGPPLVRVASWLTHLELDWQSPVWRRHTDVLAQLSVPVLVTQGRDDAIVLPSMAEYTLGHCKTASASWYDSVGHMPFVEDSVRFDRELAAFAAGVR